MDCFPPYLIQRAPCQCGTFILNRLEERHGGVAGALGTMTTSPPNTTKAKLGLARNATSLSSSEETTRLAWECMVF